jgi:cytochrome bd ubiquinol oxidase subunit II
MALAGVLMGIILAGLALYVVLGGADFGAPLWQTAGARGPHADEIREHAHDQMSPVWEANHVWLIFVLTVLWTAFPVVFGSIASTLSLPLFVAAVGIIIRGAAYALRGATSTPHQIRVVDRASAASSVLAPLALGMAVGGIASGRVPVGNAAGSLVTSWLNATSIVIGVLSVATSAYISAVFLAADARRRGSRELEDAFRVRALGAGAAAGALAVAGIVVVGLDAKPLFDDLLGGAGLPGVIVSAAAGVATAWMLWTRRFEAARYLSAVAVAAIIAGWALAQNPVVLPGLTVEGAAAPQSTLVAVLVAVIGGGVILFPSLGLLFRLVLGGRLGAGEEETAAAAGGIRLLAVSRTGLLGRSAVACLLVGIGMLTVAHAEWAHYVGAGALLAFVVVGFAAAIPALLPSPRRAG